MAAGLYPGGSFADPHAAGYQWKHNYWCELMAPYAKNGERNQSRPVATVALIVLTISLAVFWYFIPLIFNHNKLLNGLIRVCGVLSMMVTPFLLTGSHDPVINIAASLGIIALFAVTYSFYRSRQFFYFWFTLLCIALCLLNSISYYTGLFIYYLPLVQKFTFLSFLTWFALLSVKNSLSLKARRNLSRAGHPA